MLSDVNIMQLLKPEGIVNHDVQETCHGVVVSHFRCIVFEVFAYFCGNLRRGFACSFDKGEYYECDVPGEFLLGLLQAYLRPVGFDAVEGVDCCLNVRYEDVFECHECQ